MSESFGLIVEESTGTEGLESICNEWRALFTESGAVSFLSWEWLSTWQKFFGRGRTPRVLCARAEGKLYGLWAFNSEKYRVKGLPLSVRRLSLIGESIGGADYLDILALPGYEQEVTNAFLTHLAQDKSFDIMDLDGLAADSPSLPLLTRSFADNPQFRLQLTPRDLSPQVNIQGDWEDVLKQGQRVNYLNRCLRRLHKLPGYEFRTVTDAEQITAAFDRFLKLHELSWASRGGSDATGDPVVRDFLREAVVQLAREGGVRFEEIWFEGDCYASLFGLDRGERYYFYLNGYDPAWSKYSLGFTLLWLSIESAARRGVKVYDMLRGSESYKFFWANSMRATINVRVMNRSLPAKLLLAFEQTSALARIMLPEWVRPLYRRLSGGRQLQTAEAKI